MNLFNPVGIRGLSSSQAVSYDVYEENGPTIRMSPGRTGRSDRQQNISHIQNILADEGGKATIRNTHIQQKTEEV
jgi:hypothetical protein